MKRLKVLICFAAALAMPIGGAGLLTGCAATAHRQSTGQYIDDSTITTKVKAAILDDSSLHVLEIHVDTYQGVVQLSGFVGGKDEVKQAGANARSVAGVKSVKNDLRVKSADPRKN